MHPKNPHLKSFRTIEGDSSQALPAQNDSVNGAINWNFNLDSSG